MGCVYHILPCLSICLSVGLSHTVDVMSGSLSGFRARPSSNCITNVTKELQMLVTERDREVAQPSSNLLSHKHLHYYRCNAETHVTFLSPSLDPRISSSTPRSYLSSSQSTKMEIGIQNILEESVC